jgi:Putative zinc-finger
MDHTEAVEKGAVERYQLGELSAKEIDEFEAHFFECAHCAEELRAAAIFEENAKAVFLENSRSAAGAREPRAKFERERASWWALFWRNPWSAVPAGAVAALLCVVVGQARVMKHTLDVQAISSYPLPAFSRGEDHVLEVPKNDTFYSLYMDPAWAGAGSFPEYLFTVQDEKKATWISRRVPAPPPEKPLQILIPRNKLPSGRYTVIVRYPAANGQPESELARNSFILKLD